MPPDTDQSEICIGLISGTSADGIDAAVVEISGKVRTASVRLLAFATYPYPNDVRAQLFQLFEQQDQPVARLSSLNMLIGELFAEAALAVCAKADVERSRVHVIGSHGQTVWHEPAPDTFFPGSVVSTVQIGEPAVIAERTGVPVVADFRVGDIAAGGQGAPLVPYFDWVVLRHLERFRAIQNIGGIGNVTALPAGATLRDVRAFDTGPGNIVIDGVVGLLTGGALACDLDGKLAAQGNVDSARLEHLLAEDGYLEREPPKTTGRERYGLPYARALLAAADLPEGCLAPGVSISQSLRQRALGLIATVTAFTAHTISASYRRWLPGVHEVYVGGGGARNPVLMQMLASELAPVPVQPVEAIGVDADAKEAMAFALLAHDALRGLPTNVPGATGARHGVVLGKLVPPAGRHFSIPWLADPSKLANRDG